MEEYITHVNNITKPAQKSILKTARKALDNMDKAYNKQTARLIDVAKEASDKQAREQKVKMITEETDKAVVELMKKAIAEIHEIAEKAYTHVKTLMDANTGITVSGKTFTEKELNGGIFLLYMYLYNLRQKPVARKMAKTREKDMRNYLYDVQIKPLGNLSVETAIGQYKKDRERKRQLNRQRAVPMNALGTQMVCMKF